MSVAPGIPKILHYVWVGSSLPEKQRDLIETWRRHNPDYELMFWNSDNIDFSIPAVAGAFHHRRWATVADIVRLSAVLKHGGIYLDTDFDVRKSFDPLLSEQCFFGFQAESHPTDWVNNGLFGAVPGHWFIRKAYERILAIRSLPFGLDRPTKYGPKLITTLLREEGLSTYSHEGVRVKDIFIHPTPAFYPIPWDEPVGSRPIGPESYAVHLWEKAWEKEMPSLLMYATRTRTQIRRALAASKGNGGSSRATSRDASTKDAATFRQSRPMGSGERRPVMIPKILHYVWVGGTLPDKQRALIETWRQHNPDYELMFWNPHNVDFSIPAVARAFHRRRWATVADIVRLSAVLKYGGIYLDTDFEVRKSFDPLLSEQCFFGFQAESHPTDWVDNGLFGAVPGHWFIRKAYERILAIRSLPFGLDRPTKYGPKLITKLLREEGLSTYSHEGVRVKDIFIHPTPAFYPIPWDEPAGSHRPIGPESYAVHLWEKAWEKDLPPLMRYASRTRMRLRRALAGSKASTI